MLLPSMIDIWRLSQVNNLMQAQELERIRMLENRMRNPSKNSHNLANEESLVSIKSTDSKKIVAQHQRVEEKIDEIPSEMIENDAKLSLS